MRIVLSLFSALIMASSTARAFDRCEEPFLSATPGPSSIRPPSRGSVAPIVTMDGARAKPDAWKRYETQRPLAKYLLTLMGAVRSGQVLSLIDALRELGPDDVVVDFGSGEGFAAEGLFHTPREFFESFMRSDDVQETLALKGKLTAEAEYLRRNFDPRSGHVLTPGEPGAVSTGANEFLDARYAGFWSGVFEFLHRPIHERPSVLGISYEMHRPKPQRPKLGFLTDELFEDIAPERIPPFKVGIAYFGIPSYSKNFAATFAKMARAAKPGAKIFVFGINARIIGKDVSFHPDIPGRKGDNYAAWVNKRCRGIKAHMTSTPFFDVIERTNEPLYIPATEFELELDIEQRPPAYLFRETGEEA